MKIKTDRISKHRVHRLEKDFRKVFSTYTRLQHFKTDTLQATLKPYKLCRLFIALLEYMIPVENDYVECVYNVWD